MNHQPRRVMIGVQRWLVQRWRWVSCSIIGLAIAFTVNRAPAPQLDMRDWHRAAASVWARIVQTVQSAQDDHRADPFTSPPFPAQDPATQSVTSYLRAHQVDHPSFWEQLIARVRSYMKRQ